MEEGPKVTVRSPGNMEHEVSLEHGGLTAFIRSEQNKKHLPKHRLFRQELTLLVKEQMSVKGWTLVKEGSQAGEQRRKPRQTEGFPSSASQGDQADPLRGTESQQAGGPPPQNSALVQQAMKAAKRDNLSQAEASRSWPGFCFPLGTHSKPGTRRRESLPGTLRSAGSEGMQDVDRQTLERELSSRSGGDGAFQI
jgi:hypothetical protein